MSKAMTNTASCKFLAIAGTTANFLIGCLIRWRYLALALFCAAFLSATGYRASRKLFWFDEFASINIARLDDIGAIWTALKFGADFNPPLFYVLVRMGEMVFGAGHLGARAPAIVGVLVFCLCLYRFVSSRSSVVGGFVAMLFPLVTYAYWFAYEARPHAIVLACCGLAMVSWQAAITASHERGRMGALFALWISLSLALSNHALAVFLWLPFLAAEACRTWMQRRVDWPMVMVFVTAGWGILILFQVVPLAGSSTSSTLVSIIDTLQIANAYKTHLGPSTNVLAGSLVLICLNPMLQRHHIPEGSPKLISHSVPELILLGGFVLLPVFIFMFSQVTRTNPFDRYSLAAIAGFSALIGIGVARAPIPAIGTLLLLVTQATIDLAAYVRSPVLLEASSGYALSTFKPEFDKTYSMMDATDDKSLPIVLLDRTEFPAYFYYAPQHLAQRLVYPLHASGDTKGIYFEKQVVCCGAKIKYVKAEKFLADAIPYLVVWGPRSTSHLDEILKSGATVSLLRSDHNHSVGLVTRANPKNTTELRQP